MIQRSKVKKYLIEALQYVVVFAVLSNGISYYRSLDLNKEKLAYESFALLDGSNYLVKNKKPIVIHFWATWCPTCKFEASNIEEISKEYEVITIATESGTKENIEKYLEENDLSFKVVNDESGSYSRAFNIQVFPTTLIYDKEKNLKFSEVGYTTTAGLFSRLAIVE